MREYNIQLAREEIERNLLEGGHGIVQHDSTAVLKASRGKLIDVAARQMSSLIEQATFKIMYKRGSPKIYVTDSMADPLGGGAVDGTKEAKEHEGMVADQASKRAADADRVTGHGRFVTIFDILATVAKEHYFFAMYYEPSMQKSRTVRWLDCAKKCLIGVFTDTLIFGTFFPANTPCPTYTTRKTCTAMPSKVIEGATMCTWEKSAEGRGGECKPTEPPGDIIFLIIVAMMVTIVGKVRPSPACFTYRASYLTEHTTFLSILLPPLPLCWVASRDAHGLLRRGDLLQAPAPGEVGPEHGFVDRQRLPQDTRPPFGAFRGLL